jgi:hypothetical protein
MSEAKAVGAIRKFDVLTSFAAHDDPDDLDRHRVLERRLPCDPLDIRNVEVAHQTMIVDLSAS